MTTQLGEIILHLNLFFIIFSFFFYNFRSIIMLYTTRTNVLIFMNKKCRYLQIYNKKKTYSFLVSRCVSYARLRASLCPNFSFHTDIAPSLRTPCLEKEINIIIIMNRSFYT